MRNKLLNTALLLLVFTVSSLYFFNYGLKSKVLYGDALGYYLYLPATFIYHNLETIDSFPHNRGINDDIFWYLNHVKDLKAPNNAVVDQYTYGIALLECPFFLIAHAYEKMTGHPANGFSDTYSNLLKLSALVYAILGLALVYKILKNYFSPTISLLGTLSVFIGTNLFWFTLYQAGMSHVPLFFLYALLIYLTIALHSKPKITSFIVLGFTAGLITIIRPSDVLCLLIPLLYNVYNRETIWQKIQFIKENIANITGLIIAFIVPIIPQLIYWKVLTGHYFYYSYIGQSFDWLHPKIIEGLFYFSNGWLPYSPIMLFALAGMFLFRPLQKWVLCIWIVFALYVYVIYSWYCYNYLNGLGSRPMIHLYPLLAIPLTALINLISKQKLLIKSAFTALCLFFIAVNISYSIQEPKGILVSVFSNIKFNMQMLFKMHLDYNDLVVKDTWAWQPDTAKIQKTVALACAHTGDTITTSEEHKPILSVAYDKEKFGDAKWIKCSGTFMYPKPPGYYKHVLVISSGSKLWRGCTIENKIDYWDNKTPDENLRLDHYQTNHWGHVYYFVKVPTNLTPGDTINLSIDNTDKLDLYLSHVCLELYK